MSLTKSSNILALKVDSLSSVGEKTALELSRLGIFCVFHLLLRLPKAVITQEDSDGFAFLEPYRRYIAQGVVGKVRQTGMGRKKRLEVVLKDASGCLYLAFFGPPATYMKPHFSEGVTVTVSGEVKPFLGRFQMVHPKVLNPNQKESEEQSAAYSQMAGIPPLTIKRIMSKALSLLDPFSLGEHLPKSVLENLGLSPLYDSFRKIHKPSQKLSLQEEEKCPYHLRLAFEEILAFFLKAELARKGQGKKRSVAIKRGNLTQLAKTLPFELTSEQAKVLEEIFESMNKDIPMLRLLQGDVGSGKTAVSALACLNVVNFGLQAAVMAPTEVLAEQLFEVYQKFLGPKKVKVALLTSSTKGKQKKEIFHQALKKELDIVVGTQALLNEHLQFCSLGLVIIDEQHRFGVNQRGALLEKCQKEQGFAPHLLVMTATPIPRSLALTAHSDLEVSQIKEPPKGRKPIETKILSGVMEDSLFRICERIKTNNMKAFIIFPLVEESEALDLKNATEAFETIKEKFGTSSSLLVHGKMKSQEKQQNMENFKAGNFNFLISTTVVEVGVDIPDATVMVIVNAERFGLAQLHQLRGRVGRGTLKSYCFLLSDIKNPRSTAYQRLKALCDSQDGFYLAQKDLEQRGPGELLGTRQSGALTFQVFDFSKHGHLVDTAKSYASEILAGGLRESHRHLLPTTGAHFS